jgi:hypothetical protein
VAPIMWIILRNTSVDIGQNGHSLREMSRPSVLSTGTGGIFRTNVRFVRFVRQRLGEGYRTSKGCLALYFGVSVGAAIGAAIGLCMLLWCIGLCICMLV